MKYPFFEGNQNVLKKPVEPVTIPTSRQKERVLPENYVASKELVNAVNVALLLGKPLLLTGEPGTGKTLLAHRLAWELGYDEPLKFETKSTSISRDLFYHYNSLARFHTAYRYNNSEAPEQISTNPNKADGVDFITYNALGLAILRSNPNDKYSYLIPDIDAGNNLSIYNGPRRSIVLIDEIDKASRDFPNDLLNELEYLFFRIPELEGSPLVQTNPDLAPIIIITSNSEKALPDAFLRRCIFHHIEFPQKEQLKTIVLTNIKHLGPDWFDADTPFINMAIDLFIELRKSNYRLKKLPSTSELILWLETLIRINPKLNNPLLEADVSSVINITLNTLVKLQPDRISAREIINNWINARS